MRNIFAQIIFCQFKNIHYEIVKNNALFRELLELFFENYTDCSYQDFLRYIDAYLIIHPNKGLKEALKFLSQFDAWDMDIVDFVNEKIVYVE